MGDTGLEPVTSSVSFTTGQPAKKREKD